MKKILFALMLCIVSIVLFTSCKNEEKERKEKAIEFVKNSCKCPSTFELVSITDSIVPEQTDTITIYHSDKSNVETKIELIKIDHAILTGRLINKREIDSAKKLAYGYIDSVKTIEITIPEHHLYTIVFDAQNLYSAVVRNTEIVYYDSLSNIRFLSSYYEKNIGIGRELEVLPIKINESVYDIVNLYEISFNHIGFYSSNDEWEYTKWIYLEEYEYSPVCNVWGIKPVPEKLSWYCE